ncbi:MAG: DUF427 domain-containing protein [Chloroflexota bacterium]|nr:DUF427 domain-containing protein [Chloroflexota bacterium]
MIGRNSPRRVEPGPGQESVWDYPRPPRLEPTERHVRIVFNGETIADSRRAYRVLETSHPPVYYLPPEDVRVEFLERTPRSSLCEWKGQAAYYTVTVGDRSAPDAAWCYPDPTPAFAPIARFLAFYPSLMDECTVDGVPVRAQPGDFYGGWITPDILGPFKGDPGTGGW